MTAPIADTRQAGGPSGADLAGTYGRYGDPAAGSGWVLFAGAMIAIAGCMNVIDGIAAIGNSKVFRGHQEGWGAAHHDLLMPPEDLGVADRSDAIDSRSCSRRWRSWHPRTAHPALPAGAGRRRARQVPARSAPDGHRPPRIRRWGVVTPCFRGSPQGLGSAAGRHHPDRVMRVRPSPPMGGRPPAPRRPCEAEATLGKPPRAARPGGRELIQDLGPRRRGMPERQRAVSSTRWRGTWIT